MLLDWVDFNKLLCTYIYVHFSCHGPVEFMCIYHIRKITFFTFQHSLKQIKPRARAFTFNNLIYTYTLVQCTYMYSINYTAYKEDSLYFLTNCVDPHIFSFFFIRILLHIKNPLFSSRKNGQFLHYNDILYKVSCMAKANFVNRKK